jgi:NAD-dependent dihydropyrimidine dehydrogenase PreA subunit
MIREVVQIDEEKCDGCGLCVPSCQEGAIRIVNGKARLVADRLCDGMGACLGHCPKGAITIEQRDADAFDEQAVAVHLKAGAHTPATATQPAAPARPAAHAAPSRPPATAAVPRTAAHAGGCPGSRSAQWTAGGAVAPATACGGGETASAGAPSALTHWPVQLHLLSPQAPALRGARLLVSADCVPVACADFHARFLRGRAVVIACPKLDDTTAYVEKLAAMIAANDLPEITVVRMEVPCCAGILRAVLQARQLARSAVPVRDVVMGIRGQVIDERTLTGDTAP